MSARALFLFVISVIGWLSAQTITGTITGSVKDSSGLPVVGASVKLLHVATAAARDMVTNELGIFTFGSLQPGEYTIAVTHSGFRPAERRQINLSASETLPVGDVVLEIGAVTEAVTVTDQGAVVQTASAERAGVITSSQVENLLVRGRNVTSLLQLLPGVVDLGDQEQIENNFDIYVQGNRRNTNNVSLDGATLNAIGNNFNTVVNVSMDAVAEVKVLLSNYQAEYGRMSGANIQLVSKSGTRDFHGLGSYFKRHEQFNANNFFNNRLGQPKPRYRFNTWNYNVGGPIYIQNKFNRNRDKLFFFWSQEFWPVRTTSPVTQLTMPTELERAGDFSQSLDLNGQLIVVTDPTTGRPFPGNRVPASGIDSNGQALLNVFPLPNFFDRSISAGRYNYIFQNEINQPVRTETLKLDYNINSNNILSGNFTHRVNREEGVSPGSNWPQLRQTSPNVGSLYVVRYQRIFNPTLINELNVGVSRRPWNRDPLNEEELRRNQRDVAGFTLGQFHPENNPLNLIPNATFGGVTGPANLMIEGRTPLRTTHDIFTLTNNLTKTIGAHTIKTGIYADRLWADNQNALEFNGEFDFGRNVNNPLDTGYAYSNAIVGVFNSYTEPSARPFPHARVTNVEAFVQDNWKTTRKLTLDYGLRLYWIQPSYVEDSILSGFVASRFDPNQQAQLIAPGRDGSRRVGIHPVTGQIYPAALIGAIAPGIGDPSNGMVSPAIDSSYPRALIDDRGVHFAPRIGFAYDPFGQGRTAVRGGFGMFYNRVAQGMVLYPFTTQPPLVQTPTINFGTMSSLLSTSGLLFPANVLGLDQAGHVPMVMNTSLSVQHNIGFNTVVDVGYVGSFGRHLMQQRNLNSIPFGANFDPANLDPTTGRPLPPAFLRPYTGFNNVNVREGASTSNYHSLQVTANRRFAQGVQFGASWTWSKAMDFVDNDSQNVSTLVPIRIWNYGLASFDRTHVLKVNWLWDTPRGPWTNSFVKAALNDWQVSGIASFVSGAPLGVGFSTTVATDITGSPSDGARIDVTGNPVLPKSERTFDRNFRTEVFQLPARGTIGTAAKTLIRGPGINNWDVAIFKNFPIRESMRFQFRWELYNMFNHTQFSGLDTTARFDPSGNQVNGRFGEFTSARNPRQMQLALRFYF